LHTKNLWRQQKIQTLLSQFYSAVIQAIRLVDQTTPIILNSSSLADPKLFKYMQPHPDPNVLYSFHMYEPDAYTNHAQNKGRFKYPGVIKRKYWDKRALKSMWPLF